ncbi:MAG: nuclear transport factor 2 family protein [Acidimicrobiia bacterium]|nr:nuclear transport factor 2 family protein [Acidimicrobiia bacterium]
MTDNQDDVTQIEAAAADYIKGWYSGDVARMDRCLHEDLVKRTPTSPDGDLRAVSKARMLELTADGGGDMIDPEYETVVFRVSQDIASAVVTSPEYVDFLQLVRTNDGWKIVNILFRTLS